MSVKVMVGGQMKVVADIISPGAITKIGSLSKIYTGSEWMVCDGSAISRTNYADLFAAIGTTYGPGDGVNTFNIPTQVQALFVMPVGSILPYGGTQAPELWLLCDGGAYSRTAYAGLFAVIGTAFGAGDGSTTFNVPNLQGVSPTGLGTQVIGGRSKTGPALGQVREDQMQGHLHNSGFHPQNDGGGGSMTRTVNGTDSTGPPITDGTNGTPRTGTYTHGPEIGVNFIIKY